MVTECGMLLQRLPHLVRAGTLSFAFGFALLPSDLVKA